MQCLQDHLSLKRTHHRTGHPEVLHIDNVSQFANALFTKFATDWKFDNNTSSPRNPTSNGQTEAAMKTVKELLTHAKCSGQDPYLALLAYWSTPIDAHLCSPTEMLYQQALCTTVPQWIRHTDPHANAECDNLNQHATQSKEYHDQQGSCKKAPFFSCQTISAINDVRNLWLPPSSSTKPIIAYTWSKSLVVDSTDVLMTTFENIIQMMSNQIHPTLAM